MFYVLFINIWSQDCLTLRIINSLTENDVAEGEVHELSSLHLQYTVNIIMYQQLHDVTFSTHVSEMCLSDFR